MHKKALSPVCKALSTMFVSFLCIQIFVYYFLSGVVVRIAGFIYYDYATSLPSSATKNNVEGVTGKPRLQTQSFSVIHKRGCTFYSYAWGHVIAYKCLEFENVFVLLFCFLFLPCLLRFSLHYPRSIKFKVILTLSSSSREKVFLVVWS